MPSSRFQGRVEKLELARGHDGLLRGPPDPVLAIAVYVGDGSTFRILGRSLHRFEPRKPFPSDALPDVHELPAGAIDSASPFRFVVLAVAIEEDGGVDVQRIYGALEHHRMLAVWSPEHQEMEQLALSAIPDSPTWATPAQVDLLIEGIPLTQSCTSDKLIGAVCWTMSSRADSMPTFPHRPSLFRLPFLSADRKNDWTALLSIAH